MTSSYLHLPKRTESEVRAKRETLKLPPGRSEAEAVAKAKEWREVIWNTVSGPEDERLAQLELMCVRLCCGDRASGKLLATKAIYS